MSAAVLTSNATDSASLIARLERLPVSRLLIRTRLIVGTATFFDGYSTLAIAYVLPVLSRDWHLAASQIGFIISAGYLGQLVGALLCGWLAERIRRLPILSAAVGLYAAMSIACVFAPDAAWLMALRFIQGIGTGGEVPVAAAYINEFVGAKKRGGFFLLYEVIFPVGLAFAGLCGALLIPSFGWQAMFVVGAVPALLVIPLRFTVPESPRWLLSKGHLPAAERVVAHMEQDLLARGATLPEPVCLAAAPAAQAPAQWRDLFRGIYGGRTVMLWSLWLCAYTVNNGMLTWLPTLYRTTFNLPLATSLRYGLITSLFGVATSIVCALSIDRVGRRLWYMGAFGLGTLPLLALALLGAGAPLEVLGFATLTYGILQTVALSLYLYTAELYPTRMRALGCGAGSAWLRLGSSLGPVLVAFMVASEGLNSAFLVFAVFSAVGGAVVWRFGLETKGRILEELSP